jgi:hypothetical protein
MVAPADQRYNHTGSLTRVSCRQEGGFADIFRHEDTHILSGNTRLRPVSARMWFCFTPAYFIAVVWQETRPLPSSETWLAFISLQLSEHIGSNTRPACASVPHAFASLFSAPLRTRQGRCRSRWPATSGRTASGQTTSYRSLAVLGTCVASQTWLWRHACVTFSTVTSFESICG